jgi:lysophospholipase L1-like esterase
MKSVLAFGDSLTWGAIAGPRSRHPFDVRWPNVLAAGLDGRARVIEEGMNGRTTVFPDPTAGPDRNGAVGLPILLMSHQPLDLLIVMLGTNDLKFANRCRAFDASLGIARLVEITKQFVYNADYKAPEILIVSPPHMVKSQDPWFFELWDHAISESKLFARHYKRVADECGCYFFDASTAASADPVDGGHLDAANTRKLGEALVPVVKRILEI